ncbi:MAG: hypothetical protein HYY60_02265 [Parcubacteria group bacterium]|nr:hypothetical protein [Candidatus Liptonbacteria bacterium]MBI3020125.1 hypothetical protein [Parcubacteria group bacterium]
MFRFLANVVVCFSLLFFPWWVTAAVAGAAVFFIPSFYEAVIWAAIGDALYGTRTELFFNIPLVYTLSALAMLFVAERVKKMTRFY